MEAVQLVIVMVGLMYKLKMMIYERIFTAENCPVFSLVINSCFRKDECSHSDSFILSSSILRNTVGYVVVHI